MRRSQGIEESPWELERAFWSEGASFHDRYLALDALMIFPDPAGIMHRAAALRGLKAAPRWSNLRFSYQRIVYPGEDAAIVAYDITADRAGLAGYSARCSSMYVRVNGEWRLAAHHQSPLA